MKWSVFYILTKYQFKSGVSFNSSLIIYLLFIIIMNTTQQQLQDEFKLFIKRIDWLNNIYHNEDWLKITRRFDFTYVLDEIWDEHFFTIYFDCWKHVRSRRFTRDEYWFFNEYCDCLRDVYCAINY